MLETSGDETARDLRRLGSRRRGERRQQKTRGEVAAEEHRRNGSKRQAVRWHWTTGSDEACGQ